jgi:Mn-dependent DtxR family transcriptional regulator
MENKDLTAGKCEAIFILKNKNKIYAEIAKLLKISRLSVYDTLKNFGPTSFSSHKSQSGLRRKTTKNDYDRIVIISKRNRHLTASNITSEMNQSLLFVSAMKRLLNEDDLFGRITNKKTFLSIQSERKRLQ